MKLIISYETNYVYDVVTLSEVHTNGSRPY